MKTRPMAAVAALLAIALAGCGGGSSSSSSAPSLSAFKSGFTTDRGQFRQLGPDLQREITGAKAKTDVQLATEISALSARAQQQASQLSKLNPPGTYKDDLNKLVSGFNAVAADLKQIAADATKHDAQDAKAATTALLRDAATVKAADVALTSSLKLPG